MKWHENIKVKLSVVVPVYNEERHIQGVLDRVFATDFPEDVYVEWIFVDDASTDGTLDILQKCDAPNIRIIRHSYNRGKGAAVQTGFQVASGEILCIHDADLEYDPNDIRDMLEILRNGDYDFICGIRKTMIRENPEYADMRPFHRAVNKFLTNFCNCFMHNKLQDMECCYKLIRRQLLKRIKLQENRFGIEPELALKLDRIGARITQHPVAFHPRTAAEGKKINWKDGISAIRCILKYGLFRS
mgnify:CR=1 FL=1